MQYLVVLAPFGEKTSFPSTGLSWQPVKNQLAMLFQLLELSVWHGNFQLLFYSNITILTRKFHWVPFYLHAVFWHVQFFKKPFSLNLLQCCFCFMLFFFFFFWPGGMWYLNPLTRDQTCTPCIGGWSLNHWTTREVWHVPFNARPWYIL